MKTIKNLTLFVKIAILTSCAGTYSQATYVSNNVYIGMPISEFRSISTRKAKLEAMESGYTVYRVNDYGFPSEEIIDTKFYYFDSNGKLVKIDGGEFKQRRYQIEIK